MSDHDLRAQFPHTQHQTYLNHAAISPLSRAVRDAVSDHLSERHGDSPTAPIANFEHVQPIMERAKARIAEVLRTTPDRVDFSTNTSSALNVLCRGLDWKPGDRVAVPEGTFPTNVYPFMNLAAEGVEVDMIPTREGAYTLDDLEQALHPDTRLLSISWVHYLSGFRADLASIGAFCEAHDVLFCVDAIQGLGALTIDVEEANIDFLAAGGHKWLMATQGIGVLYCAEDLQDELRPPSGWLHGPVDWEHLDEYELTFHDDARRFRTGTLNSIGVRALDAALGVYLEAGPDRCEERVLELSSTLADALEARGMPRYGTSAPDHASGIVTVAPEAPEALFEHLQRQDVVVALRNRKVRFAPTYYNDENDLQAALDAVDSFDTA